MVIPLVHYAHAATSCTTAVRSTQQIGTITVQPQIKDASWNEWLAWPAPIFSNAHGAAAHRQKYHVTQQIVYMITVQLPTKMYSWNEWLALPFCSVEHARSSTAVAPQHAADCVHDNRTATIKDVRLE
jgi:hypothetical protein